jgi:23S rRNA pseudouridine1911/1915/1917 synthase
VTVERRERLDRYLVISGLATSRREAEDLIARGLVSINGHRPRKSDLVAPTDEVAIDKPSLTTADILPQHDPGLAVLYYDAALVIIDKPGAMPCHPLKPGETGTVMNAVVARYPETTSVGAKPLEGGLVHRLDNGTSGALIIARTPEAYRSMRMAISSGRVSRLYQALVAGDLKQSLTLDAPIAHHEKNPRKMKLGTPGSVISKRAGRAAMSVVEPIRRVGDFTLVAIRPRTGSRHQIRVHLASAGHPIVGDALYGGPPATALAGGRFWLHLTKLSFESPTRARVEVSAPLPPDLKSLLR